jgi:hypothetical protein
MRTGGGLCSGLEVVCIRDSDALGLHFSGRRTQFGKKRSSVHAAGVTAGCGTCQGVPAAVEAAARQVAQLGRSGAFLAVRGRRLWSQKPIG